MIRYLFIDTETTGLPNNWDAPISDSYNWPRLVQVAWIVSDEFGNTIKETEYFIYPDGFNIPKKATEIHGITTEEAKQKGELIDFVLLELNEDIKKANAIIGHNINFDEKVLRAEFYRHKITTSLLEKKRICTMKNSTSFCTISGDFGYKWPSISELHFKLFKTEFQEAHNALNDIKVTKKCFWELIQRGVIKIPNNEVSSKERLNSDNELSQYKHNNLSNNAINEFYANIWNNLSENWKSIIISEIAKKPEYQSEYSLNNKDSLLLPLDGEVDNQKVEYIKQFFTEITYFETGLSLNTLEPIVYFEKLHTLTVGEMPTLEDVIGNKLIIDYAPIAKLTNLLVLDCKDTLIKDLSPVKNLTNLQYLYFSQNKITSLIPLKKLINLKVLDCSICPIKDLSPIEHLLNLEKLNISHTRVNSLAPLENLTSLEELDFSCALVSDISVLSYLIKLRKLKLNSNEINYISALANLKDLRILDLSNNPIVDIKPLVNLKELRILCLDDTKVYNIDYITELTNLRVLELKGTDILSLEPLRNLENLFELDFRNTAIYDVSPILGLPKLKKIYCDNRFLREHQISKLKEIFPKVCIESSRRINLGD